MEKGNEGGGGEGNRGKDGGNRGNRVRMEGWKDGRIHSFTKSFVESLEFQRRFGSVKEGWFKEVSNEK